MNSARLLSPALLLSLLLSLLGSVAIGAVHLDFTTVLSALWGEGEAKVIVVIREIRLPRAVLGAMIGASLGLSGAVLQGTLRNPLAEPGITGTSSCAAFGAVLALYFGWAAAFAYALPLAAMTAAALGTVALLGLAGRGDGTLSLILAGVALSSLAVALTTLAMTLAPNPYALSEMVLWLLGSLHDRSFEEVKLALPFALLGWLILGRLGRGLDALSLGEETAASLGVNIARLRLSAVLGTALCVGASVAVAGCIGFVGLVVPHLIRPLVKHQPSALLLPSALGGALLITLADTLVRVIPSREEVMLGVVTALIGIPFFLTMVVRNRWEQA